MSFVIFLNLSTYWKVFLLSILEKIKTDASFVLIKETVNQEEWALRIHHCSSMICQYVRWQFLFQNGPMCLGM